MLCVKIACNIAQSIYQLCEKRLDQVENDFNEYYPNVTFAYEQIGGTQISEYLDNNPFTDIFMTSDDNICFPGLEEKYTADRCADLTGLINESDVIENMLNTCYVDGKLLRIPMAQRLTGVVVNVGLLEKDGLSVPQNWGEFTDVMGKLKDKGYTPVQGPVDVVYSGLISAMAYNIIGNDTDLENALTPAKRAHTNTENPWYGFSVNKDAEDIEYANEFIRFLATRPELDQIAEIKGVPPITKNADAERYTYVQKVQQSYHKAAYRVFP